MVVILLSFGEVQRIANTDEGKYEYQGYRNAFSQRCEGSTSRLEIPTKFRWKCLPRVIIQ